MVNFIYKPVTPIFLFILKSFLALSYIMRKNGQTHFKNLAMFIPQDF